MVLAVRKGLSLSEKPSGDPIVIFPNFCPVLGHSYLVVFMVLSNSIVPPLS
jgi:hypothetical protein